MEAADRDLATKLTQLQLTRDKTEAVLASRNGNRIKRHRDALFAVVSSVDRAKRKVEELKIAAGEEITDITTWGDKVDADTAAVDDDMERISKWLNEIDQEQVEKARTEQLAFEKQLFERKLQYNKELQASSETQNTSHVDNQNGKQVTAAKLPKLTITKFNGTTLDWKRFWGQFTEGIDKSDMAAITKFSYLKEFVEPKVRKSIDGLPFTAEGYERAKSILSERYGNDSDVEKAYVKDILDLPKINRNQPRKIHQFYERLLYDVQSLETMGKLSEVNGNVALTIDKLSGIRGDLVRNNENWQTWDFLKLCDALKLWTRRNPVKSAELPPPKRDRSPLRNYNTRQQEPKTRACVYCEDTSHKSSDCARVARDFWRRKNFVLTVPALSTELPSALAKQDAISAQGNITLRSVLINSLRGRVLCLLLMLKRLLILLWWLRLVVLNVVHCWILVHLVVMLQPNCWTCWDIGQQRSSLKELRCLWLLPQREWRFSNQQFHQGLVITS